MTMNENKQLRDNLRQVLAYCDELGYELGFAGVEAKQALEHRDKQAEPVALINDACAIEPTIHGAIVLKPGDKLYTHPPATVQPAGAQEPVAFNNDAAWDLAQKVRTDLDRKCCPGPFMDLAMELINKHYTHTAPYVDVNDQILGALKDAATAFDRINHWLEGRGYGGLKPSEIIVLNKLNSAIAAAEAAKKGGM